MIAFVSPRTIVRLQSWLARPLLEGDEHELLTRA
jgi:hypothetical protein